MKALITGITGFAGPYLAEHLLACGDEVCGTTASNGWPSDIPEKVRHNVALLPWNLSQPLLGSTRSQLATFRPEVIYHLAAISIPEDCGAVDPTPQALAINVEGTRAVAELSALLPSQPRILFTSTAHVYARPPADNPFVTERAPIAPASGYGKSKWAAEEVLLDSITNKGGYAVIARVFKHSGARQLPRLMLPQWAAQLVRKDNSQINVYSLNSHLDLCDVRDVSRAYRLLVEKGAKGEAYNIGSGINRRSGDIFSLMEKLSGQTRTVVETRPGHRQETIADITKLTKATGWRPEITLEQTVQDVYEDWQRRSSKAGDC